MPANIKTAIAVAMAVLMTGCASAGGVAGLTPPPIPYSSSPSSPTTPTSPTTTYTPPSTTPAPSTLSNSTTSMPSPQPGGVTAPTTLNNAGSQNSGTYAFAAIVQSATFTGSGGALTSLTLNSADRSATATVTYDGTNTPSALTISLNDPSNTVLGPANHQTKNVSIGPTTPASVSAVQLDDGVTVNSTKQNLADIVMGYTPSGKSLVNFSYQDFGPWAYTTSTGGSISWFSYGIPFSGTMPTSGSATYLGIAKGNFINPSGVMYNTTADMTATADFGAGTIAFSTSSTNMLASDPAYGTTTTVNTNLNLTGTLTITGNNFTGTVANSNSGGTTISGNASGLFYGQPVTGGTSTIGSPREIGGTYAATGADGTMMGAFGGKAQ